MRGGLAIVRRARGQVDASLAIVNIVLLLIFFFMMAGTFLRPEEVPVDPAETNSLPLERLPRPLLVLVDEGNWQLDGLALQPEDLASALGEAPPKLHVLAAKSFPARALVALGALPELSGTQILLVTLHRSLAAEGERP